MCVSGQCAVLAWRRDGHDTAPVRPVLCLLSLV